MVETQDTKTLHEIIKKQMDALRPPLEALQIMNSRQISEMAQAFRHAAEEADIDSLAAAFKHFKPADLAVYLESFSTTGELDPSVKIFAAALMCVTPDLSLQDALAKAHSTDESLRASPQLVFANSQILDL